MLRISSTVRSYPKLPYEAMVSEILGDAYAVSLTFIGAARAKKLNQQNRGKEYVPNVLSFPLSRDAGEVYIAPSVATREAPKFEMTERGYIGYLFIHGLLHLKGIDHGAKMDTLEEKYRAQFKLK